MAPSQSVEVTTRYQFDLHGPNREYVHMTMALIPDDHGIVPPLLRESDTGLVAHSVPMADNKGSCRNFVPSVSGHDYIIASWGDSSFYSFNLAEKVWMALGLTPRCVGNDSQRVIYDDLSLPELAVAEGEISNEYYWKPKRNISWTISNEYLRRYLWMRNAIAARVFHYQVLVQDEIRIRKLMNGSRHVQLKPKDGWYELDIREHNNALLLQIWATVTAALPELCPEQSADGILWPDIDFPVTYAWAGALTQSRYVFLDDKFLQRYEQNGFYNSTPVNVFGNWHCCPSYAGQWSFTECVRVGRNLIRVPIRELYKPKPDREIVHAHSFAKTAAEVSHFSLQEEHIVSKVQRLLDQLLNIGDNLSALGEIAGLIKSAADIVGLSRVAIERNGWAEYPQLCNLYEVAPLDMSQQAFLSRCKSVHELYQRIPSGFLRAILKKAGCPHDSIRDLQSLKLLQALLNIVKNLNAREETKDVFVSHMEPEGWKDRNISMAPLFLNYDLRIADAHNALGQSLQTLQALGFDTAKVNDGYGRALDFVLDGVIDSFGVLNYEIASLLRR